MYVLIPKSSVLNINIKLKSFLKLKNYLSIKKFKQLFVKKTKIYVKECNNLK